MKARNAGAIWRAFFAAKRSAALRDLLAVT